MSQNYVYPSSSDVTITGIGTPNNSTPIPPDSVLIAGENPSGNQQVIQTDAFGNLITTPAAGSTGNVNLTEVGGAAITLGQKTSTTSIPVVIASDDTVAISAVSLPLPIGASTSALQTTGNTTLSTISSNQTNGTQVTSVSNFPATQPVSGTITANQGTANATPWNDNIAQFGGVAVSLGSNVSASSIPVVIASDDTVAISATALPLPTGAATSANQTSQITQETTTATNTTSILANQTNGTQKSQASTPTALTVHQAAITVGTAAVRLTVSGSAPASTRVVLVATPDNTTASTVTFYIGSSTVTNSGATRGIEIAVGQSFIANNDAGDYYIVSSVAGQTVTVMEQY